MQPVEVTIRFRLPNEQPNNLERCLVWVRRESGEVESWFADWAEASEEFMFDDIVFAEDEDTILGWISIDDVDYRLQEILEEYGDDE